MLGQNDIFLSNQEKLKHLDQIQYLAFHFKLNDFIL